MDDVGSRDGFGLTFRAQGILDWRRRHLFFISSPLFLEGEEEEEGEVTTTQYGHFRHAR